MVSKHGGKIGPKHNFTYKTRNDKSKMKRQKFEPPPNKTEDYLPSTFDTNPFGTGVLKRDKIKE